MAILPLAGLAAMRATLRERAYGIYVSGNSISLVGNWMQRTAVGWLAWELEGSVTWLGIVAFIDLFSGVVISPIGGVLADRHSRRGILLLTQSAAALLALVLFALTWTGMIDIRALCLIVLVQGAIIGINQPARLALIPSLVSRRRLPTAVAINSIVFNTARFVGPALAGLAILGPGLATAFLINALSYLVFIAALTRLPGEPSPARTADRSIHRELFDGIVYVVRHRVVSPMLVLFGAVALLVRPFTELLPAFAAAVHGEGAGAFAALSATLGAGAVAGGFAAAGARESGLVTLALLAALGLAAGVAVFALTPILALALPVIFACGALLVVGGISAQTLVQLAVEPELRGRVMSLYGAIFRGAPGLGALLLGPLADRIGLPWAITLGVLTFLLLWARLWRRRHRLLGA